jgi:hypothetical protein
VERLRNHLTNSFISFTGALSGNTAAPPRAPNPKRIERDQSGLRIAADRISV